jgi:hypothetical protein
MLTAIAVELRVLTNIRTAKRIIVWHVSYSFSEE